MEEQEDNLESLIQLFEEKVEELKKDNFKKELLIQELEKMLQSLTCD